MPNFVNLATNLFTLNGSPLKLPVDSMRHMFPIYNRKDNMMLLKFGRQTHKSTTIGNKLVLPCVKYQSYNALYVAPTGNQVSVFSTDKLDGTIRGSRVIQKNYISTKTKDQITYKEFTNNSKIYLRSAYHSADSIRGISADMTCLDEIQDVLSDHIPVIQQCMSHSLAKWEDMTNNGFNLPMHLFNSTIFAGTPKTIENTLEQYWHKSTQNEWIIRCKHCTKWNYINEDNVGDFCLICSKCSTPIFYEDGQWVSMNRSGILSGYRVPQIILNWINNKNNPESWRINVINTREMYSTEKFYNEVLALPYANARNPINPQDLMVVCKDDMDIIIDQNNSLISGLPIYGGVDWGKGDLANGTSYTVIFLGTIIRGRFRIIYMRKYKGKMSDPLVQLQDIIGTVIRYNCALTLADSGDGRTANAEMVKQLGPTRFAEVFEHGTIKQKIKWDGKQGMYIINRTRIMTDRFLEIKRNLVDFPNMETFEEYKADFLNIYTDYSERTRMSRYDHVGPDDAFHAYMFCRLASMIHRGEMDQYLSGGLADDSIIDETIGG